SWIGEGWNYDPRHIERRYRVIAPGHLCEYCNGACSECWAVFRDRVRVVRSDSGEPDIGVVGARLTIAECARSVLAGGR
ncbi:hypothetical protein ABZ372_29165, partial [Streptomyces sp. NPDC005921]